MRKGIFSTKVAAVLAAAALALTACGGGSGKTEGTADASGSAGTSEATQTGTITAGAAYETTDYNPTSTSSALAMGTNWHVVEALYSYDSDFNIRKELAADDAPVEVSDTQYEVKIRPDAAFSDGTPVTADDVIASFEKAMAPENLYASMLSSVKNVEKKDDSTVTINLNHPFTLLKDRLTVVKIVPKSATADELKAKPVGSGPWKYDSITDTGIEMSPNEHYNGPFPAKGAHMHWDIIKDDNARTTAAQDGTIAVMEAVPADRIELLEAAGLKVEEKQGFNLPFLLFNTSKAPFNDARVRQAFHYAIDTQKLIANAMDGKAKEATGFLPETSQYYNKAKVQYTYNPEKAKELLAEAGVSDLSITLQSTDHPWIEALGPQIKNDLEAVGVKVELNAQASASLYSNNLDVDNATFDVALAPGDPSVFGNDPDMLIRWWYGDNLWTQRRSFMQKGEPEKFQELQNLLGEAVQLEGDAREAKWNEAMDLVAEEAVIYPLFHRTMITAYNPELVEGVTPVTTTGLNLLTAKPLE